MVDIADNSLVHGAGSLLGKKYGPLPFGAWLVVVGGTAFFVKKFVNSRSDTTSVASDQASASSGGSSVATTSGTVASGIGSSAGNAGTDSSATTAAGTSSVSQSYADNQAWKIAAVADIISAGQYSGTDADTALRAYLSGTTITDPRQKAIVDTAIKSAGLPPEAILAQANATTTARGNSKILIAPQTGYQNVKVGGSTIAWQVQWTDQSGAGISGVLRRQVHAAGDGSAAHPDVWADAGTVIVTGGTANDSHPANGVSGGIRYATLLTETLYSPAVSPSFFWTFAPQTPAKTILPIKVVKK